MLHWLIAALFAALVASGAWMTEAGYYHSWYPDTLHWHRALGALVLLLAVIKLSASARPRYPFLPPLEAKAAHAAHGALFVALAVIPLSGYVISTAAGKSIPIFGSLALPALFEISPDAAEAAEAIHYWAAYGATALVAVHVAAALKHHFIDKNEALQRLFWRGPQAPEKSGEDMA